MKIEELAAQLEPEARRLALAAHPYTVDLERYRELALRIGDYVPTTPLSTTPTPKRPGRDLLMLILNLPPSLQLPHLAWYLRYSNPLPIPRSSGFRDRLFFSDAQAYRSRHIYLRRRQEMLDEFNSLPPFQLNIPSHHEFPELETAIHLFLDYGSHHNARRHWLKLKALSYKRDPHLYRADGTPRSYYEIRPRIISNATLSRTLYEIKTSLREEASA